jgi:hypothetical protein
MADHRTLRCIERTFRSIALSEHTLIRSKKAVDAISLQRPLLKGVAVIWPSSSASPNLPAIHHHPATRR